MVIAFAGAFFGWLPAARNPVSRRNLGGAGGGTARYRVADHSMFSPNYQVQTACRCTSRQPARHRDRQGAGTNIGISFAAFLINYAEPHSDCIQQHLLARIPSDPQMR
jgi:hypothetical protein